MPSFLLPPEVLALVFHFLLLEESPYFRKQNRGWIRVTHVCWYWRQVALDDSSLWARISGIPTNTEWVSETLARARNAPLDIDIDLGWNSNPQALSKFSPHISHTRSLRLLCLTQLNYDSFRDICSQKAPILEHFYLRVIGSLPLNFWDLRRTMLFKGRAPKLQTFQLLLTRHIIPWSLIPHGQLTQLKIALIDETSTIGVAPHGDLNHLIDILVNSPGLELLVLRLCLPSQLTQFLHGPTIHLPRLSRLRLTGSSSRVTNLFRMLRMPFSTALDLRCISETTPTHSNHLLLSVISAHFQSPVTVEFKLLSVAISYVGRRLEVAASTSLSTSRNRKLRDHEFVLSFEGLSEHVDWSDFTTRVCKTLHIPNLEFLSVSAPGIVDPVNWVELFEPCTRVTTMQATGRGTASFVRALTTPNTNTRPGEKVKKMTRDNQDGALAQPAGNTASPSHEPLFPKLTFMKLAKLDFAENNHHSGILFDVVQKGLRQRKLTNRALKTLHIDNCIVSTKCATALEMLVSKFYWDGNETLPEESEEDFNDPWSWWEQFIDGTMRGE